MACLHGLMSGVVYKLMESIVQGPKLTTWRCKTVLAMEADEANRMKWYVMINITVKIEGDEPGPLLVLLLLLLLLPCRRVHCDYYYGDTHFSIAE